jgi:hypothetical protein
MSLDEIDTTRVVRLLLQDAVPTLGARAHAEVLRLAANYTELAHEWRRDPQSAADAQRAFDRAVIDNLQQTAHDLFWDTTWPACPLHRRHPLWYDEDRDAWCCEQDGTAVAPLGSLARLHPPAT